eukprot:GAHX01001628.1.p1 GENE.GAHX01001628.1~~GAHX01001628.1.p1  ORF type:complete len:402 (+),score=79.69 GAHX01001628.1:40-1206(+)
MKSQTSLSSTITDEDIILERLESNNTSQESAIISPFTPYKLPSNSCSSKFNVSVCERSSSANSVHPARLHDFDHLQLIGRGGSSFVYSTYLNKRKIAIKSVNIPLQSLEQISYFTTKMGFLCSLKSRFVLKHYFGFLENSFPRIATEYCEYGTLNHLLKANPKLPIGAVILLCRQLSEGLKYVHDSDVVHGDISTSNILVSTRINLKIGDFGLSKQANDSHRRVAGEGDFRYLSPESNREGLFTIESDIFALGLVFLRIALNKPMPKSGEEWVKLRSGFKSNVQFIGDIINGMLKTDPKQRLNINTVNNKLKEAHTKLLSSVKNKKQRKNLFNIIKPEIVNEVKLSFTDEVIEDNSGRLERIESLIEDVSSNSPIKKIKPMNLENLFE